MAELNQALLKLEILASKALEQPMLDEAQDIFDKAKANLLIKFDTHPVTLEIEGGASSANLSGTLSGYGNLFTFIGFEDGEDPISPLRNLLEDIKLMPNNAPKSDYIFTYVIYLPSDKEIEAVTPMPWENGRSWAFAVEQGISNFSNYMNRLNQGRSGGGIQIKGEIGRGGFKTINYITQLLDNFARTCERGGIEVA